MGALPQVLEIIFEVEKQKSNEKIIKREISFLTYKTHFFSFLISLNLSYFQTS